jgi:P2 family phage contractile tail tube protein
MKRSLSVNNFNLYVHDFGSIIGDPIGTATVEIPEIQMQVAELNQAGMGGKLEIPLTAQSEPFSTTINASGLTIEAIRAAMPKSKMITARIAAEAKDVKTGSNVMSRQTITMRGTAKSFKIGTLEKAKAMDTSITFPLDYIKIMIDGVVALEHDVLNNIFIVDGVDYAADIRDAI